MLLDFYHPNIFVEGSKLYSVPLCSFLQRPVTLCLRYPNVSFCRPIQKPTEEMRSAYKIERKHQKGRDNLGDQEVDGKLLT
jgi:hypothetical protein